jgi:hypothetical protein
MAYRSLFTPSFMYSVPVLPDSNIPGAYGSNTSRAGLYYDNAQRVDGAGIGPELGRAVSGVYSGNGDPRQPMASVHFGATTDPAGPMITKLVASNLELANDQDNSAAVYKDAVNFNLQWHDGQVMFAIDMDRSPWCGITPRMSGGGMSGDGLSSVVTVPQLMYLLDGLSISSVLKKDDYGVGIEKVFERRITLISEKWEEIKKAWADTMNAIDLLKADTSSGAAKSDIDKNISSIKSDLMPGIKKLLVRYANDMAGLDVSQTGSEREGKYTVHIAMFDEMPKLIEAVWSAIPVVTITQDAMKQVDIDKLKTLTGAVNTQITGVDAAFKNFRGGEKDKAKELGTKYKECERTEELLPHKRKLCYDYELIPNKGPTTNCTNIREFYMRKIATCVHLIGVSCGYEDVDRDRTLLDIASGGTVRCQNYWGDMLKPGERVGFMIAFPEDKVYGRSWIYPWKSKTKQLVCKAAGELEGTIGSVGHPYGSAMDGNSLFFPLGIVVTVEPDPSQEERAFANFSPAQDQWPNGRYLWPLGRYDLGVNPSRAANEYKNVRGSVRIFLDTMWDGLS